ncbi:12956_t:CDS:2 [Racocetra fulgida]|uniref:12956_t:CDS:1 n=1 Tax=Racocetra fulgida TaxID=60492 RepID=A0A9N9D3X2_9GLOM|nr:12956_t:CDS:2 [Racocetra fulgida]
MITHLQFHNIVDSKKLKSEEPQKQQATLPAMLKSNTNTLHKSERRKKIVKGVIKWILLDNESLSAPRKIHFFDSPKQQKRLEKAQIRVIERDILLSFSPVYTKAYAEVYFDNKEVGKIDDGGNTELEKLLNINITPKPLCLIKDCPIW